ncbi:MAG TPA: WD40 repeat domain-containing protein [Streptosporangiaceae bacterium]|nr:WD40 repeat domain-containing protein [Streptosporangiaceae bacterium]
MILLDGIDELRLRDTSVDVLTWLTDHTQFPENVRFVVASRPDERLNALIGNERADVKRVTLTGDGDARRFAELIADGQLVGAALVSRGMPRETFVSYAARRAGGNFRYLALLRGLIEENAADLDWLAEGADRWPDGLNALYRDYLLRTRDRVGRATRARTAWETVYRPVLGVLAVAEASLTAAQIEAFGGITATGGETCATALERLGQLLLRRGDAYRFDHVSLADFLTDARTEPELRTDSDHWHQAITGYAFGRHAATGNWSKADPYLLVSLPVHAEVAGRLDELIEDPRFLVAADLGDRGILSRLGAADRARPVARLLRQVLPMLRRREPGVLAHLHMYACLAHEDAFAAKVAALITGASWSLTYCQWQPERVRGVIGQHDGEIRALAVTRDEHGKPVAITGGADRVIRVWDLTTGTQRSPLRDGLERADPRPVWALAAAEIEPGKPLVAGGDSCGTVRAWDLTTGTAVGEPMEDFGNCGHAIGVGTMDRSPVVLCRAGNRLRLWDLHARLPLAAPFVAGPGSELTDMAALAAGLAAVRLNPGDGPAGEQVRVFSLTDGRPRGFPLRPAEGFPTGVALARAQGGYAVVLADIGGGVQAFDLDTGEPRWDRAEHDVACTALTAGELDGRMVVVGGDGKGRVRIWELSIGREIGGPYLVPELDGGITAIGIVPSWDGGRLVLAGSKRVRPADDKQAQALDRAQQFLSAAFGELARDTPLSTEPRLLTAARPGPGDTHLRRGTVMHPPADVTSVAVADGEGHRVIISADGRRAFTWHLTTGERVGGPYCGPADHVAAVALTGVSQGRPLAVCGIEDTVHTWDVQAGVQVRDPERLGNDRQRMTGLAITERDGGPAAVCSTWSDGAYALDLGSRDGIEPWADTRYLSSVAAAEIDGAPVVVLGSEQSPGVLLSDARTGEPVEPPHPPTGVQVISVAVATQEGRTIVVSGARDRTLRTWDPASPDTVHVTPVDADVTALGITALDGYPVAVCGGPSGEVRVVDLVTHAEARDAIGPVTAVAVSGEQLICGTERGLRIFRVTTGEPLPVPATELRRGGFVASGSLHGRPIALAAERYGRGRHCWYTDTGDPVTTMSWPADSIDAVTLADDNGTALAVFATFQNEVIITEVDGGGQESRTMKMRGRITDAVVIDGVVVSSEAGLVRTAYLREEDRPPWPDGDDTPPQPRIFEDRALPNKETGLAMTAGTLGGKPFVACGNDNGEVALYSLTGVPLTGSPLDGSADKIAALSFAQLAGRPVLASGALDGTVRVWDLNDISAPITIATLAGVNAVALAEPDLCVIGTRKGLLTVRLRFASGADRAVPMRSAHDIRADRVCPYHDSHEHPSGVSGGPRVPTVCVKGVQFVLRSYAKRRPSLTMPNAHCYHQDGQFFVVSSGETVRYPATSLRVGSYDQPLGHWDDGSHFGITVRAPDRVFAVACYRRGERDRLLRMIMSNGGSLVE